MFIRTVVLIVLVILRPHTVFASTDIFVEAGEKIFLKGPGPFHFSSQKNLKVFLDSTPSFATASNNGVFEYNDGRKEHQVFVLKERQMEFYKSIEPATSQLNDIKWTYQSETLILRTKNLDPTIRTFLIERCLSLGAGEVSFDFQSKEINTKTPLECRHSMRPKSELKINIIIVRSSKNKNYNYGLGVPGSIQWRLEAGKILRLADQTGGLNLDKGSLRSKGLSTFSSRISLRSPVKFETGSEVGIQPQGLFNRQAIEWKKATTQLDVELVQAKQGEAQIKLTLNKRSRTAQNSIFELESLNKTAFLEAGKWQKVLEYRDNSKDKIRNGVFGLGLTGSANSAKSLTRKEVWIQVTHAD